MVDNVADGGAANRTTRGATNQVVPLGLYCAATIGRGDGTGVARNNAVTRRYLCPYSGNSHAPCKRAAISTSLIVGNGGIVKLDVDPCRTKKMDSSSPQIATDGGIAYIYVGRTIE